MLKDFVPRRYQEVIFSKAIERNTLVVLPTGLGKTAIALMISAHRIINFPKSKIVFLAPTKPLIEQHRDYFQKYLLLNNEVLSVFSGTISPEKRKELWKDSTFIFSTPQGFENDILSGKISFEDVSLIIFDEAHRAVGDYSYIFLAKKYMGQAKNPLILSLSASPGDSTEKINELCKNLFIENIEYRSLDDEDVKDYVEETKINWVEVDQNKEFTKLTNYLNEFFQNRIKLLNDLGLYKGTYKDLSKSQILKLQSELQVLISKGETSPELFKSISVVAEILKMMYANELAQTQTLNAFVDYMEELNSQSLTTKTKSVKNIVNDIMFKSALITARDLISKGLEHPKIAKLKHLITDIIKNEPSSKIIIFSQYRQTATELKKHIDEIITSEIFFGQAKKNNISFSQKKQKEILDSFRNGNFSCLIATSVAEEGLDIPKVDHVIFYEPVPSAIRSVQRRGRTGRHSKGFVSVLITKGTQDEIFRWVSFHKEKKMYSALNFFKNKNDSIKALKENKLQKSLTEFSKNINNNNEVNKKENETKLLILADYREKASPLLKELSNTCQIELKNLDVGDYFLGGDVCVEFKNVRDFVDSIVDGRLLSQLKSLVKYEKPLIVIEGTEDLFSIRKVHPKAIHGMLATISISYRIPIIMTKNAKETADLFITIAKREQIGSSQNYSLHSEKPQSLKEQQEYVVGSFPGIGSTLAKPLLEKFGSIKGIVNANEKDFQEVSKIGPKKTKAFLDLCNLKYTNN